MPPLDSAKFPKTLTLPCPLCEQEVVLSILWETEHGEMGSVLSRYPVVDSDPDTVDHQGDCYCHYTPGFLDTWDQYLQNHGLDEMLSPPREIQDLTEVLRFATSALSLLDEQEFHKMEERIQRLEESFELGAILLEDTKE